MRNAAESSHRVRGRKVDEFQDTCRMITQSQDLMDWM